MEESQEMSQNIHRQRGLRDGKLKVMEFFLFFISNEFY